ncbi:MAG: hypothetical protein KDE28_30820, partial [Anaerolineales bacterium]|nr:hypothetical protein [Anaerolineales bacterium]
LMKLRSDMLFLTLANVERRVLVLTEQDMFDLFMREKNRGRVPLQIEFAYAEIPMELVDKLHAARKVASKEVSPQRQ